MTNNTLFCGVALLVIGLVSYFGDTPGWNGKVNQFLDKQHEKAVKQAEEAKQTAPDAPKKKENSPTALIPAGLGALLLVVVGVVIYKPDLRKHAMHFAALVGAAAVGGGIYAVTGGLKEWDELGKFVEPTFAEFWASLGKTDAEKKAPMQWDQPKVRAGALTALVGLIYVIMAVKSFIDARKAQANPTPPAAQ